MHAGAAAAAAVDVAFEVVDEDGGSGCGWVGGERVGEGGRGGGATNL